MRPESYELTLNPGAYWQILDEKSARLRAEIDALRADLLGQSKPHGPECEVIEEGTDTPIPLSQWKKKRGLK